MFSGNDLLIHYAITCDGDYDRIMYGATRNKDDISDENIKSSLARIKTDVLTMLDPLYPDYLKHCMRAPIVMFYKGDISLLNGDTIGICGARELSAHGERATNRIVNGLLNDNKIIVTGTSVGASQIALSEVIRMGGKAIVVLPCGMDNIYPDSCSRLIDRVLELGGLVISEYPDFVPSSMQLFPMRNRIIAAISKAIVVTESKVRGGSEITVSFANTYGKDVFCVPAPIDIENQLTNELIKDGAMLVCSAKDITDYLSEHSH